MYLTPATRGATALPDRPPRPAAWTDLALSAELARGEATRAAWDAHLNNRPMSWLGGVGELINTRSNKQ
jgi:hypothetical protein